MEGAMSGCISRVVIVRRGILRRSCGTATISVIGHMFGVPDCGCQVGTREVADGLQESNYVATRGVGATSVIWGLVWNFLLFGSCS